ncbi:MAG: hypothetical protein Q8P46_05105 [Hyphomicrobiales bacterium]|nr:hypothetical protein [Hyphomicrobiales bacterium]
MTVHCFTSISYSYLNRARVLGETLKRHHPEWTLWLCITDKEPEGFTFNVADEPYDEVLFAGDLDIPNIQAWLFKHDVVEACTAVKGLVLERLTQSGAEKIFYIDPDIAIFASLQPMVEMLDDASVLLTPHQLEPDHEIQSIYDNEICSLSHGTYNLGFVAIRNDNVGRAFARWWCDRCTRFCYDERDKGLFVDQKWCDLVPAFFENVRIVRDPGYNVASWNLNKRKIDITGDGQILINGTFPLRFYHFTKLGPIGDTMTRRYAGDNVEVYELWAWYKRKIDALTDPRIPNGWWHYGYYSNNVPIPKEARVLYRYREDLRSAFPNPFDASQGGYLAWYENDITVSA